MRYWTILNQDCRCLIKFLTSCPFSFNSSPPTAACLRQWTGSGLVQVMACRRTGDKPLPEPNAGLLSIGLLRTNLSEFESKFYHFSYNKMDWKLSSAKMAAILSRGRWVELAHRSAVLGFIISYNSSSRDIAPHGHNASQDGYFFHLHNPFHRVCVLLIYRQVSNIRCTLEGKWIVGHSDVVGA